MKENKVYIQHILDAVEKIERYSKGISYEDFLIDPLRQDGIIRELEIIGEAAKKLSDDFKENNASIPWRKVTGMRDKLIHDYFEVDAAAVWKTVKEDIPAFKRELLNFL